MIHGPPIGGPVPTEEFRMAVPSEMKALLLVGEGYAKTPSGSALEAMEPYLQPGVIEVPTSSHSFADATIRKSSRDISIPSLKRQKHPLISLNNRSA